MGGAGGCVWDRKQLPNKARHCCEALPRVDRHLVETERTVADHRGAGHGSPLRAGALRRGFSGAQRCRLTIVGGAVNGGWLRAAGAGRRMRLATLDRRFWAAGP